MENTEKSAASTPTGGGGAKEKIEKQARQLAYDVRYKVRQGLKAQSGGKSDPATVKKAYLAQLGKSPSNPAVKTRAKQMLMGEDYININKVVAQGVASAMYKVFVEHHQTDSDGNVIPHEETSPLNNGHKNDITEDKAKEKTYKVRVTDKESGNSYVRNATRAKIAELRNNPNISSVEMTEYGEVTKSEKYKGSKTASVKSGKGVDYDGDGKVESGSKEHAGVVHNAIQKKKGGTPDGKDTRKENYTWKEAFSGLIEKKSEEEEKKITGKGVNNKNLIKVFPDEVKEGYGSKKKKKKVAEDAEYGYDKEGNSLNPEDIKKKNEKDPNGKAKKEEEEDYRSMGTKANLVKNKLRAMGLNMSQEPEGETIEEAERKLADRLARKRKVYDKTTKKAMQFARDEGEASGHARYRMSSISREMDGIKAKMNKEGYQRDPEQQEKERKTSKQSDPSKDNFTGISGSIATIMKQNAAMKKAAAKKVKKEEVETIDELKSTTLLSYSNKAANELAFKGDGGKKAQKRATGVKRAAGQLTMKAINKEEYDNTKSPDYAKKKKALAKKHGGADKVKGHPQYESVASAVDALNSYFNKNQNLHGSVTAKKN